MSAKHVLEKDVQNIESKQVFARWQSILSVFDFDIEYIKGSQNSILTSSLVNFYRTKMADKKPQKPSSSRNPPTTLLKMNNNSALG